MCVIIVQPEGVDSISHSEMEAAFHQNPHGAGYMFTSAGHLMIRKPFYSVGDLLASVDRDRAAYGDRASAWVYHFRLTTHGDNSERNVHPHALAGGAVGMVHNGILPVDPPDKSMSDTVWFSRTALAHRPPKVLMRRSFADTLGDMIGANKLALMDRRGNVSIVNAHHGKQDDSGVWRSNTHHLEPASALWLPQSGHEGRSRSALAEYVERYRSGSDRVRISDERLREWAEADAIEGAWGNSIMHILESLSDSQHDTYETHYWRCSMEIESDIMGQHV